LARARATRAAVGDGVGVEGFFKEAVGVAGFRGVAEEEDLGAAFGARDFVGASTVFFTKVFDVAEDGREVVVIVVADVGLAAGRARGTLASGAGFKVEVFFTSFCV